MKPTALAILLAVSCTPLQAQHPILPGVERLRSHESSSPAGRGAVLLRELACTACHRTGIAHLAPRRAPDLREVGARVSASWLGRFLADPQAVKPGTLMPGCVPDAAGRSDDLRALVQFLVSRGGPQPPATVCFDRESAARGRQLFASIGCVACHQPERGGATAVSNVPLGPLAHKYTVDSLERFLSDPHAVRPGGRMPKLWLTGEESRDLAMHLLRDQADNPQAQAAEPPVRDGLLYEYFEVDTNELPDFDLLEVKRRGTVPELRLPGGTGNRSFAVRLRGDIRIPEDGAYTFRIRANDGARLLIDGEVVVPDDRVPGRSECTGQLELRKGRHRIEVQYFQHGRGRNLDVSWTRPDQRERRIPGDLLTNRFGQPMVPLENAVVARDPQGIGRGAKLFTELRCAACHEPERNPQPARPLDAVDAAAESGCLGGSPRGGAVSFALSQEQRSELRAALAAGEQGAPTAGQRVQRGFAAFNCYACHERGGIGGPEEARYEHFTTRISIDLGDEGRLPPPLSGVGYKLRPVVIEELLAERKHRIRERFIATRMPGYPADVARELAEDLVAADARPAGAPLPAFSDQLVAAGRKIVGVTGFGCVTCHNVNGDKAAGIPGVDIASSRTRLNKDWFREFLRKPGGFRPNTRMPGFWGAGEQSPFADILDGTTSAQIDAVWTYLSLGRSMPAPDGVQRPDGSPKAELIPADEVIVHRTFMLDVGPRTILAGFPEKLHVAFDAQAVRLAKAWRGRFFDASGVASGRSGTFLGPLGGDVLDLPAPAFARLQGAQAPWPEVGPRARDVGGDFLGLRLGNRGAPTFRYRLAGVEVREEPRPRLQPGGASLRRSFALVPGERPPIDFHFRAWRGAKIEPVRDGVWRSGPVTITLQTDPRDPVRLRTVDGGMELVVLFVFRGGEIRFEEEIRW